jgi:hypothetical protein
MCKICAIGNCLSITFGSIPVAARSEAWVCGPSVAGIAGSNPSGAVDVSFL